MNARRILDWLGIAAATALIAITLSGVGNLLDGLGRALHDSRTYASYGYEGSATADAISRAVDSSLAADQRQCEDLHGPNAVAMQLPDGSHRCADKHGRRLARNAVTIPSHRFAQVAP